ncbi:ANTAR domain-containing protein [Streptomyces sp. NPDC055060]
MAVDVHVLRRQLDTTHHQSRALVARARQAATASQLSRKLSRERRFERQSSPCPSGQAPARPLMSPPPDVEQHGAAVLSPLAADVEELRRENTQLRQALVTRSTVDQARGVLMAVGSCGADRAWEVLVDTSQRTNIKLRHIAEMIVASTDGGEIPAAVGTALKRSLARQSSSLRAPASSDRA